MIYDHTIYNKRMWFEDFWNPYKDDPIGSSLLKSNLIFA